MHIDFSGRQRQFREEARTFADAHLRASADRFDSEEALPPQFLETLRRSRLLAAQLPSDVGGRGVDMISYGLLHEEIGKVCSSVRSLITVHDMVAEAVFRCGSAEQRQRLLPALVKGQIFGAVATTEPAVGSDLSSVEMLAEKADDTVILNGTKCWITGGQIADIFLVLARCGDRPTAFLVERNRPGLSVCPVKGMLGVRASMLAKLTFHNCGVPLANILGRPGLGLASIVGTVLGLGRYSVAWGCVGLAQACLDAVSSYANTRRQFGVLLKDHQLVQQMISRIMVGVRAARLLCCHAGCLKESGSPEEASATLIAKYFASTTAAKIASDTVQLHGANGCSADYSVQRYYRDAKIMEIIEGSTQIHEVLISSFMHEPQFRPTSQEMYRGG